MNLGSASSDPIRRLVYASRATGPVDASVLSAILVRSRAENGIDGISGVLLSDGSGYLQVLEGTPEAVGAAFDRISRDPRHADVVVHEDGLQDGRAFGDWAMASPDPREDGSVVLDRLDVLMRHADPSLRGLFTRHAVGTSD